jgi:hypothetical protein
MSNLIPEQRLDKNNRMVTRWVKPSSQGASASSLPAPKVAVETASEETMDRLQEFFKSYGYDEDCEYFTNDLTALVAKMPRETAEWFGEKLTDHLASDLLLSITEVTNDIYGDKSKVPVQHRETVLRNYMSIIPEYVEGKDNEGVYAAHFAAIVFRGSGGYEATEPYTDNQQHAIQVASEAVEDIFPVPDPEQLEGTGFTVVNGLVELADRRSVDLIVEHADIAAGITDILKQRKTFHPDVIREIAASPSLGSGVL